MREKLCEIVWGYNPLKYAVIVPTAVVAYSNIPWMIEYLVSPTVDSIKKLTRARKLE